MSAAVPDPAAGPSRGPVEALRAWLRAELARRLAIEAEAIHDDDRFAGLGLDSLGATALAAALSLEVGRRVSPALLWAYPSVAELARHMNQHPESGEPAPAGEASRPRPDAGGERDEPVAVVGMACRFPGAGDLDGFWALLREGTDAVCPVPGERWIPGPSDADGRVPVQAGFLTDPVDAFDPLFFGISPREAAEIDPQQRLFLEVAWEALQDAGLAGDTLRGSRTGVFAGAIWHDYADLHSADVERLSPHSATGRALNMVSNRLSYVLGLRGPSMTLDSACSSSLLAVHLACQSLRSGESDMALAGGVNLLLSPATMVSLTRFGGLAPDGRCKAFDSSGDGFGRGEGCGVIVLKPLSRALADGDRIWCLIKGSAVNNDGPSNGLTAPSPLAQEDVLRQAYRRAGVSPADVHFVETHGTGTALGDPIEAAALGAVFGPGRPADAPLVIGAVKTNIGHLEGAAGIAGVIKTALCLHHGGLPANLHFRDPNPHIDFSALRLRVPTDFEIWPKDRRVAGVSSFGWGGTNVHAVLEGWQEPAPVPASLPEPGPASRAVRPRVAFVCAPHGHQWVGMARRMLRTEPVFRAVIEECDRELARHTGWSVLQELFADGDRVRYDDLSVTQPVLFAVEVALAAWLQDRGVRPDVVVGHSLGEIAAAVIAGFLDIPEAARLVYHYSGQQARIAGRGEGMAVVEMSAKELAELIEGPDITVAARNGPRSTALAGSMVALERLLTGLKARGVLCSMIRVDVAAHSPAIDEISADLVESVGRLVVAPGRIPMVSTVTAKPVAAADLDAEYFAGNLREPVLLADATAALLADGCDVLVELSANPVLLGALRQSVQDAGGPATALSTMSRGEDDRAGVWEALLELNRLGAVCPGAVCPSTVRPSTVRPGAVRPGAEPEGTAELFTLSAMTAAALRDAADQVATAIAGTPPIPMPDLATASARRVDHPFRLAAVASTSTELAAALRDYAEGSLPGRLHASTRPAVRVPKVVFVFPGQGSQWPAMGRDLLAREPVFAASIRKTDAAASRFVDWSILEELGADKASSRLDRIDVVQPTLFAVEIALAELWRSWGVHPDAVVGHSMGETAASYIAGAVSLEDAARVICLRSRLMLRASGRGAMLAAELTASQAREAIGERADLVSVAVSNSRRSTVLSGDRTALGAIADELARREVFCRWVKVDVASHSPQMDALCEDLLALLDGVRGGPPRIPMPSTVTGRLCQDTDFDADYWFRNLRMPVLFGAQIEGLARSGHTVFVEMSPHPILLPAVQQAAVPEGADPGSSQVTVLPSLRRAEPARAVMLDSLGALYALGVPVDRTRAGTPGRRSTVLPAYPWQRERHWIEPEPGEPRRGRSRLGSGSGTDSGPGSGSGTGTGTGAGWGSLPGERLDSAIEPGTCYWQAELDLRTGSIGDHVIGGRALVPGSGYLALALRCAGEVLPGPAARFDVTGLWFQSPLVVGESGRRAQITLVRDEPSGAAMVRIFDDTAAPHGPVCVAEADVYARPKADKGERLDVEATQRRLADEGMSGDEYYADLALRGLSYGPAFRRVLRISRVGRQAFARIGPLSPSGDNGARADTDGSRVTVDPALLDAAIQTAIAPALYGKRGLPSGVGLMSVGIESAAVHRSLEGACYARSVLSPSRKGFRADVTVYDLTGDPLVEVIGVTLLRVTETAPPAGTPASPAADTSQSRTAGPTPGPVRDSLLAIPDPAGRREAVGAVVTECVAAVARMSAAAIDPDTPLRGLGIDSLMAMELRNHLEGRFGIVLSATVILNHPTVRQLVPLVADRAGIPL